MRTEPPPWAVRTEADRKALADGYYWDAEAADRIIRFAERYVAPKYVGGEFTLFPWQRRFLQCLYGWRRPDGGRRFRLALLHVPKKNGKTLLVSVLAAYELFAASTSSPLVCSASTTRENARQVFDQVKATVAKSKALTNAARVLEYLKVIKVPSRDGEFRALSADAPNAEGLNCSAVVVDEAHAHRSAKLYRTLEYSTIGRADGILVVISTAGDDLTHWYYGLVQRGRNLLAGNDTDPTFYAEIYEAEPEKDDVESPDVWRRVNPSLDLYPGFTTERFGLDLAAARSNVGDWLSFQRYRLNIFKRPDSGGWIDLAAWDQCRTHVPESALLAAPCWLGFDASQRVDPTSLSAVWLLPEKRYFCRSWAWVAEAGARGREQSNLPKYQQFAAAGAMTITPGDAIEKEPIREHILRFREAGHQLRSLVMDPNGAWVFGTELAGDGIEVFRQPQSFRYFSEPTKELEIAVAEKRFLHDGNPWLRWCVQSVRLDTDTYGNVRPARGKSVDKIDGAVSTLLGFALALKASADVKPAASVYESRGIEFL